MEWLEKFEIEDGQLVATVLTKKGTERISELGDLRTRGLPTEAPYLRDTALVMDLQQLECVPAARYYEGLGLKRKACGDTHDVFIYRSRDRSYLIPALALARGLFPLVSSAFDCLFTPRSIYELCVPVERDGHWSTVIASYHFKPKASGVPAPMREALTWVSLFPSGAKAWTSVYHNALEGRMRMAIPGVRVRAVMAGILDGNTVYVTSFKVSGLLAFDEPHQFAHGAPKSYLWHQGSTPLYEPVNAYHQQTEASYEVDPSVLISDAEWAIVEHIFDKKTLRGGEIVLPRRELADAFLKRMVTNAPWTDPFYKPFLPKAGGRQWLKHKLSGQLTEFIEAMRTLRPDSTYLLDVADM